MIFEFSRNVIYKHLCIYNALFSFSSFLEFIQSYYELLLMNGLSLSIKEYSESQHFLKMLIVNFDCSIINMPIIICIFDFKWEMGAFLRILNTCFTLVLFLFFSRINLKNIPIAVIVCLNQQNLHFHNMFCILLSLFYSNILQFKFLYNGTNQQKIKHFLKYYI